VGDKGGSEDENSSSLSSGHLLCMTVSYYFVKFFLHKVICTTSSTPTLSLFRQCISRFHAYRDDPFRHVLLIPLSIDTLIFHKTSFLINLFNMWLTDAQKIGVALTTFGGLFMLLGVMLFFDGALLALGNILFVSGLTLIIGPQKTFYFFARKQKLRGTVCFIGGILLVFFKRPFIGMLIETFGFLNLFGDFFPVVITFLRQLPFIGTVLSLPYIRVVIDRIAGSRTSAV